MKRWPPRASTLRIRTTNSARSLPLVCVLSLLPRP